MKFLIIIVMLCGYDGSPIQSPHDGYVHDHVDVVEINHYYDERGGLVLDQAVYYDWSPAKKEYVARDWRLIKNGREQVSEEELKERSRKMPEIDGVKVPYTPTWIGHKMVPVKQRDGPYRYMAVWQDGRTPRKVTCDSVRETWTQYDAEIVNRAIFSKEERKGLKKW